MYLKYEHTLEIHLHPGIIGRRAILAIFNLRNAHVRDGRLES